MRYLAAFGALMYGLANGFTPGVIIFILFVLWSIPLSFIRLKFRQAVYKEKGILIIFKPKFKKEIVGLFGNLHPKDTTYLKYRNIYRVYLLGFLILYLAWKVMEGA